MTTISAVYVDVTRVPQGDMRLDSYQLNNAVASNNDFILLGGLYHVSVLATNFGTVTLQKLGPDGTTYLTAMTAFSANGVATASLPPGQYRLALAD